MGRQKSFPLLIIAGFFLGCTVGPQLSPMQIRQITTTQINANYEDTFRASLTVLQDQGYIIKNTDMQSGLIVAQVDRATSGGSQFAQALLLGYVADKGVDVEISCMVNKLSNASSEIRLNIQETKYGQSSWWSGTSKQNTKQIYDQELYRNIFNEIRLEVRRRQAVSDMSSTQNVSASTRGAVIPPDVSDPESEVELDNALEGDHAHYFEIIKIVKRRYFLIKSEVGAYDFNVGETYEIVEGDESHYVQIGRGKVVIIHDDNIVLQVIDSQRPVEVGDIIKYRK